MEHRFFTEDTVLLKQEPSIVAVVEETWRDIDNVGFSKPEDWILHSRVSQANFKQCMREGKPPTDHVIVRFMDPCAGCTLIKESDLILKNRSFMIGDVVKRSPSDIESGYVTKVSMSCTLKPIYTGLPWNSSAAWPHKAEENRIEVPEEDIVSEDFQIGNYVLYKGWVGEVADIHEQVTVKLEDGSVVRVAESEALETSVYETQDGEGTSYKSNLVKVLALARQVMSDDFGSRETSANDEVHTGQVVFTKKSNLRLGHWVIGSYNPSVRPRGIVVEVRVIELSVDWLSSDLFGSSHGRQSSAMPPELLTIDECPELRLYNRNDISSSLTTASNTYGSRRGQDLAIGEIVRFRDTAGAAVKYSEASPDAAKTGIFRRIPRADTLGFDMNAFQIVHTAERATIQWQSGTTEELPATQLTPYHNVDEHDIWVGELCSLQSAEEKRLNYTKVHKLGVVQSVDARERIAIVKWFVNDVMVAVRDDARDNRLIEGGDLGPLSGDEEQVSVYEIMAHPALNRRRGDLVSIAPSHHMMTQSRYAAMYVNQPNWLADPAHWDASMTAPTSAQPELRWFGEVVDLGKDGLLTVRLGGLDQVEDIKVPVTRLTLIASGDDEDFDDGDDEFFGDDGFSGDESSDDYDIDMTDEEEILEEIITYEGGRRMDDGTNSDDWTDDAEDDEDDPLDDKFINAENGAGSTTHTAPSDSREDVGMTDAAPPPATARAIEPPRAQLQTHPDYDFSSFPNMPAQFKILDSAPPSHPFLPSPTRLTSHLMRRIRKEHAILESSLPPGIWVRSYETRLDLLRVLIIGPRGTPYELAPFVLDFHFHSNFPDMAPRVYFHSWTNGVGRINPNLYEDGKVCLSILGTWPEGGAGEGWRASESSILQVLVSLMGLVLVKEPYYNEAGFEALVGSEDTVMTSRMYSEKAYCMAKGFIAHALSQNVGSLEDIVDWLYNNREGPRLLKQAVQESQERAARGKDGGDDEGRLSAGAEILMRRHLRVLEAKLQEQEADLGVT